MKRTWFRSVGVLILEVSVLLVAFPFLGCNAGSSIRRQASSTSAQTNTGAQTNGPNQVALPVQAPELPGSLVLTGLTTVMIGDPYGLKRLLPESAVTPLRYENAMVIGALSESDKDQLALLVARLPILSGFREIKTIVVIAEGDDISAELFLRGYRVYCIRKKTKPWTIVRATSYAP